MTFIYALIDPITKDVRYIGKSNNPHKRLFGHNGHIRAKTKSHKHFWIKSLLDQGFVPTILILEKCEKSIWQEREKDWIKFGRKLKWPLTNMADGGEGYSHWNNRPAPTRGIPHSKIAQANRAFLKKPFLITAYRFKLQEQKKLL
jgi:hypothetical protein